MEAKKYPVAGVKFLYAFKASSKLSFETGLDFVYNEANFRIYNDTTFVRGDIPQIGIFGGIGLHFNKSVLDINYGYYLLDKIDVAGKIYNRIGYRYYIMNRYFLSFAIKAHYARADYF